MFDIQIIKYCLYITPESVCSKNLKELCMETLNENKESFNTQESGHVVEFNKIISLEFGEISLSGNTPLFIEVEVKFIKPEKDMIFDVEIIKMLNSGIFCKFSNINFWISNENIYDYKYNLDNNKYVNSNDEKLNIGDIINIKVTLTRYENKLYSCIGEFKDEKL